MTTPQLNIEKTFPLMVMNKVDLMTVKELLGHKDIKMTILYAHLSLDHKMLAVQKLESLTKQSRRLSSFQPLKSSFPENSYTPIYTPKTKRG